MSKVTRFPVTTWQRIKNQRGKRAVSCIVSERWLEFSENSDRIPDGEAFWVNVMTMDKHDKPRKICELAITKEELLVALDKVKPKP